MKNVDSPSKPISAGKLSRLKTNLRKTKTEKGRSFGQVVDREDETFSGTALNFRVPESFHREFKSHAARRGISMLQLLFVGFRLTKENERD